MHPILKNLLALVLGIVSGSVVNLGLINLSIGLLGVPNGFDLMQPDTYTLLNTANYLGVWVAHAAGTLAGAYFTARFAASVHLALAMVIGVFFLLGGIAEVVGKPAPLWFEAADLVLAYLPMGWLGWKLACR